MKFTSIIFPLAIAFSTAHPLTIPILSEYLPLLTLCTNAGSNSYVAVEYASGTLKTYDYGACYPYSLPGDDIAQMAVFCRSVSCVNNPYANCTGASSAVAAVIPALTTLVNVDDFVRLIGQGATCYEVLSEVEG